ncbi:MAG: hypothetical protein DHS20C11_28340 [Lysobacteraceae bacterium]|nr:MAG: hypothetical protein DHS20C11_28340 [Xanthomonadaceae bacterium]
MNSVELADKLKVVNHAPNRVPNARCARPDRHPDLVPVDTDLVKSISDCFPHLFRWWELRQVGLNED